MKSKKSIKQQVFLLVTGLLIFQAAVILIIFSTGIGFKKVEQYTYDILNEKTSSKANHIEHEMTWQWSAISESTDKINETVQSVIDSHNEDFSAIYESKDINKEIMCEISDRLMYMMKKNKVNDAFVILDSGDLYQTQDGNKAVSCIYLRDINAENFSDEKEILLEIGDKAISEKCGISTDTYWTESLEMIYGNEDNYDFFNKTIESAKNNPELTARELAKWSGFSQVISSDVKTIKYTVPLINDDNVVYGVIGVGITENNILGNVSFKDASDENTCYVLGIGSDDDNYRTLLYDGEIYSKLVGEGESIVPGYTVNNNITVFNQNSEYDSLGCIYPLNLYSENSPYYNSEKWAVISLSERNEFMKIRNAFMRTQLYSILFSILICGGAAVFISRKICRPLNDLADTFNNTSPDEMIQFAFTGIKEIDQIAEAVEDMQIMVEESSSRFSEIINLVDAGIGLFMIDRTTESVFMSESLVRMLEMNDLPEGDVKMEYYQFTLRLNKKSKDKMKFTGNPEDDFINNRIRELKIAGSDGNTKWFSFNTDADNKKILGVVQDITESIVEKNQIEYERDYDMMTGLLNRRAYYKRIGERFLFRSTMKIAAIIMVDLDNLKYINDTYGHDFGDDYIKSAANFLKEFENHNGIVSRLSGDEFSIFLSGFNSKMEIRSIISDVREKLMAGYCQLPDRSHFKLRCSMGVSWYPENSEAYDVLMKYADFAMYTIKKSTKGSIAEFDMDVYRKDSILITGIEEMNRIIDECSVKYAFHSIVSAKDGSIYGYEALMRPQSEIIKSPLDFLRIAKTAVRLSAVENLTWHEALKNFRTQLDIGSVSKGSKLFVNSISNCVLTSDIIEHIEKEYSDILSDIVLEVLESEEKDNKFNERKKKRVKKWNAQIALDDFGTGYNSELALITTNPNIIKIDRSIISGCDRDESRRNIMLNLIKFAATKDIKVLAEGVETYDELKTVIECGVDFIQGYYVSKPLYEPVAVPEKIVEEIQKINSSRKNLR